MKRSLFSLVGAGLLMIASGCSHPVFMRTTQATVTYSDRLPARIGLYLPEEVSNYSMEVSSSGTGCEGHTYPMQIGKSFSESLKIGAETAAREVVVLTAPPTPATLQAQNLKFVIIPRINNVDGDVSFSTAFFSNGIKATFQTSITMNLMDGNGKTFHSFSSNGTGFSTGSGSCGDGADVMSKAAGSAFQQLTDNVAQTLNSSMQVRDAIK